MRGPPLRTAPSMPFPLPSAAKDADLTENAAQMAVVDQRLHDDPAVRRGSIGPTTCRSWVVQPGAATIVCWPVRLEATAVRPELHQPPRRPRISPGRPTGVGFDRGISAEDPNHRG
jgi:hypothetical protein